MSTNYPNVFQPISLGPVRIKNRITRSAHGTGIGGGIINDDLIAYHEARAKGGVGLTTLEIASVHPTCIAPLTAWNDEIISGYQKISSAVHTHGMKLFQQLWHAGHHSTTLDNSPPWSASDVPSVTVGIPPLPMSKSMIDEMVSSYAEAALRCKKGGLDGVEIHGAHGYLIGQFLSPLTNLRTDEYGGTFENRLRFVKEVIAAVRNAVGVDFAIGIRLSGKEGVPGGITPLENQRIATNLEETGLLDFFSISTAGYLNFDRLIGGMHEKHMYELEDSTPATRTLKTPSIVVGRIKTIAEAEKIIKTGQADMVSMVRATIADPDIVNKALLGNTKDIRPCLGCNQGCIGGATGPLRRFGCVVNVGAGQELRFGDEHLIPVTKSSSKSVIVVGGGPSGLEAARVAAMRGHKVSLYEEKNQLGGQVQLARRAPNRDEFGESVDWLEQQIRDLEVEIFLNTRVDSEIIKNSGAEVVIVATGSFPKMNGFQAARPGEFPSGVEKPHVFSSWDVMEGSAQVGNHALVLDDIGHYTAIAVSEHLLEQSIAVTFATRHYALGSQVAGALLQDPASRRLTDHESGFKFIGRTQLVEITENDVLLRNIDSETEQRISVASVILISGNTSRTELLEELDDFAGEVHVVGDALSSRPLEMAIHTGHYAALKI